MSTAARQRWPEGPRPVLFVAPPLWFCGSSLGCLELAAALEARGSATCVLTTARGRLQPAATPHAPVVALPWLAAPGLSAFAPLVLGRRLRALQPEVVHAHGVAQLPLARRLARALGRPLAVTVYHRGGDERPAWVDWRGVGAIVTFSDHLKQDLVNRRGAPRARVEVVRAGTQPPAHTTEPLEDPERPPVLGTLVECAKPGSTDVLLRAVRRLLPTRPRLQVLLAMDSESPQTAVRRQIERLGLRRQVTICAVERLQPVLEVMDVCVLPRVEEGPGQPLLEALAAARPVVVGASGAAYDVVRDEETGLLFRPDDEQELAHAIERLLDRPDWARELGRAARRFVTEHCSIERAVDDLRETYRRLGVRPDAT
ncbi:MAG: glycosyltransferase family 1 protein [Planctomycetota bacterium]|nr:MAG: glycosyltransferase family 1 protein [Planctomycetota bacterium]